MLRILRFISYISIVSFASISVSCAGIVTVQALDFGSFALKSNASVYEIIVNVDGSYSYDTDGFILVTPPQEGIYDITDLAVSTAIGSVTVTQVSPLIGSSSSGGYQMRDLQESSPGATDASGVARITVGGTARSDGGGILYHDDVFTGTLRITINF